jgi:hypothetical protein
MCVCYMFDDKLYLQPQLVPNREDAVDVKLFLLPQCVRDRKATCDPHTESQNPSVTQSLTPSALWKVLL